MQACTNSSLHTHIFFFSSNPAELMHNESQRMVGWASHGSSNRKEWSASSTHVCVCVCSSVCDKIILISDLFVAEKIKDSSEQIKCQLLHWRGDIRTIFFKMMLPPSGYCANTVHALRYNHKWWLQTSVAIIFLLFSYNIFTSVHSVAQGFLKTNDVFIYNLLQ